MDHETLAIGFISRAWVVAHALWDKTRPMAASSTASALDESSMMWSEVKVAGRRGYANRETENVKIMSLPSRTCQVGNGCEYPRQLTMMARRMVHFTVLVCLSVGTSVPLAGQMVFAPRVSADATREIPAAFLGVNTRAKITGLWDNPIDCANLDRMSVKHLRFPGGTVANYYDWTTGDMILPDAPHPHSGTSAQNYQMAQLLTAHENTGVVPVFVLNLVTSYRIPGYTSALESQLAMLRHARQIGLPVERIEMGNELYASVYDQAAHSLGEVNMRGFLDAYDYYATASSWVSQIRSEFPEVKIGLVDTVVRSIDVANANRKFFWNRDINALDLSGFDALVRHYYSGAGLLDPQTAAGSLAEIQEQQWELFLAPNGPGRVIGNAFSFMADVAANTQKAAGVPAWNTEFNLMDKVGPIARTWSHALFAAALLHDMLDDPSPEMITSHSFHGHKYGAVFFEDDEFPYMQIDPGYSLDTVPGELSAVGHLMSVVNGAFDSMTQIAALDFGPVPMVGGLDADVVDHPALVGYLLQNGHDQRMIVTNFSSRSMVVDLAGVPGAWARALVLDADPRRHILGEEDVNRSEVPVGGQLSLPAYSLAVIAVPEPATLSLLALGMLMVWRRW